ncbi:hypothetical protein BH09PLA1_BH09PLA1_19620 [soil metagenome]
MSVSTDIRNQALRYSVYGLAAALHNHLPALDAALNRALGEFSIKSFPGTSTHHPAEGTIKPYDKAEVLRHLSPSAVAISSSPRDAMELYQDNERFWLIDDRWGLTELNLLKGHFRSWILPEPSVDVERIIEMAVIWPIAQLLRGKGLHLLPAAGLVRAEVGLLILSPFGIEPELTALLRTGFRVVGQRWTALRDEDGRVTMLHMPGRVERHPTRRLRSASAAKAAHPNDAWIDLESEFCGSAVSHGTCTHVLIIEPGRRPTPMLRQIPKASALPALRRAWPIAELHPLRAYGQFPAKLSRRCDVFAARLSQRPQDLLELLDTARGANVTDRDASMQLEKPPTSIAV